MKTFINPPLISNWCCGLLLVILCGLPTLLEAHAVPKAPALSLQKKLPWLPAAFQVSPSKKQAAQKPYSKKQYFKRQKSRKKRPQVSTKVQQEVAVGFWIGFTILATLSLLFAWGALLFWVGGWFWLGGALVAGIITAISNIVLLFLLFELYSDNSLALFLLLLFNNVLLTIGGIIGLIVGAVLASSIWVWGSLAMLLPIVVILLMVILINIFA